MNEKILVIEDDQFTQEFYKYFFKKAGYSITITEKADEIISIIETENVALIVLDVNLKNSYLNGVKTDGVQIARFVKESKFNRIPILIITAYQDKFGNKSIDDFKIADDYIIKPINDFDQLLLKVRNLIDNGKR